MKWDRGSPSRLVPPASVSLWTLPSPEWLLLSGLSESLTQTACGLSESLLRGPESLSLDLNPVSKSVLNTTAPSDGDVKAAACKLPAHREGGSRNDLLGTLLACLLMTDFSKYVEVHQRAIYDVLLCFILS